MSLSTPRVTLKGMKRAPESYGYIMHGKTKRSWYLRKNGKWHTVMAKNVPLRVRYQAKDQTKQHRRSRSRSQSKSPSRKSHGTRHR